MVPWRLLALLGVLVLCLYISTVQTGGNDFWLQAKIGEIVARDHTIPDTLLFPFTEVVTQKFNAHEWLASVLFHGLLRTVGEAGLPFVTGLLGVAYLLGAISLAYLRSEGNGGVALLAGLLALGVENYRHAIRPELLTLILLQAYWWILERHRRCPHVGNVIASACLVVIWANSHGSFILAPVMACIYAIGIHIDTMRQVRSVHVTPGRLAVSFLLLFVAVSGACLLTPFGGELLAFVFEFGNNVAVTQQVAEWGSTLQMKWLHLPGFWLAVGAWLLTLCAMVVRRAQLSAVDILFFVFFTALALKAIRFPVYLGTVAAFVGSGLAPASWKNKNFQSVLYHWVTALSTAALTVALVWGNTFHVHHYTPGYMKMSDGMVRTLSDPQYRGHVLNSFELGAELVYRAYPRLQPAVDSRVDSYGTDYIDYQKTLLRDDTLLKEFVARYDVRYLLLDLNGFYVLQDLRSWKDQHWKVVFQDRNSVFLARND